MSQKIVNNPSENWGGKRPNAGRPLKYPGKKKRIGLFLTEEEISKVKEFIQKLRDGK